MSEVVVSVVFVLMLCESEGARHETAHMLIIASRTNKKAPSDGGERKGHVIGLKGSNQTLRELREISLSLLVYHTLVCTFSTACAILKVS